MPWFRCEICYGEEEYDSIEDMSFLWNDELYKAFPVCHRCIGSIGDVGVHLNYEPIRIREKVGMEKWL